MKCLIVDPSLTQARILEHALRTAGAEKITSVGDADQARAALASEDENDESTVLIITEWDLPGDSGIDFVTRFREQNPQAPPILMTSSRSAREDVVRAQQAGVAAYVLRPLDSETLVEKLIELLPGARAKKQSGDASEVEVVEEAEAAGVEEAGAEGEAPENIGEKPGVEEGIPENTGEKPGTEGETPESAGEEPGAGEQTETGSAEQPPEDEERQAA